MEASFAQPLAFAFTKALVVSDFKASEEIGFPIVVRPSYVLGGRAMELVHTQVELEKYLKEAVEVSDKKPILFATIIIISLIAVENGIFLEATPPFYDFCAKTCKQLFSSPALLGL